MPDVISRETILGDKPVKKEVFHGEPMYNVISKEEFQKRVETVFDMISKSLATSFGPYGSPTIIADYPFTHVTKDGFTIQKNFSFDIDEGSIVDLTINQMIGDICGRLNYIVGDATTTAILVANAVYQYCYANKHAFETLHKLPRDIMKEFASIKDQIIKKIEKKSISFTDTKENMLDGIRKVVRVSSNGDDKITDIITEIYDKIGYPSISVETAKDDETKYYIIDGFKADVYLRDKLYINTDDNFCEERNMDVIIFDHRIENDAYNYIIRPLHQMCKEMARKLLVIAPAYSENTMSNVIRRDLITEYEQMKQCTLILTTARYQTATSKRTLNDLAMLFDTTIIDRSLARTIIQRATSGEEEKEISTLRYFNFDRNIKENMRKLCLGKEDEKTIVHIYQNKEPKEKISLEQEAINVGFVGSARIGIDYSVFSDFYYNKNLYEKFLDDAKTVLDDTIDRYAKSGTFNYEVMEATKRYNALGLKTAVIEAGGDSELSKGLLKDSIVDSIHAAESAYNNGYILGCNVTTIRVIDEFLMDVVDPFENLLFSLLHAGFMTVFRTVLSNAFDDTPINFDMSSIDLENETQLSEIVDELNENIYRVYGIENLIEMKYLKELLQLNKPENETNHDNDEECDPSDIGRENNYEMSVFDYILYVCVKTETVFDLETKTFNKNIINSSATDKEVLTAVVDLVGILITGNQMVITNKHNF